MAQQKDNSKKHGYWIHTKVQDGKSVTGYFILPECKCSKCGYVSGSEKDYCPRCRAIMDGERR